MVLFILMMIFQKSSQDTTIYNKSVDLNYNGVSDRFSLDDLSGNRFLLKCELDGHSHYVDTLEFGLFVGVRFIELNNDGVKDFIIETVANNADDILYLSDKGSWSMVDDDIVGLKKLNIKNYYFTYKAVGCADNDWNTRLVSFSSNGVKEHAELYVKECDDLPYEAFLTRNINSESQKLVVLERVNRDEISNFWVSFIKENME